MIEITIKNYLEDKLNIPVLLEEPIEAIEKYLVFEKTSSSLENRLPSSTFAFQSYADSLYETLALNNELKKAIDEMIGLDEIGGIGFVGDYNFTDLTKKKYRYQAVYNIYHY